MSWGEVLKKLFFREERKASAETVESSCDEIVSMSFNWEFNRKNPGEPFYYTEKRRFARFSDGQEVFCYPMTSLPIKARILDASLGGMRLNANESLSRDQDIGIAVFYKGTTAQFLVRVLWESNTHGSHEYGVEFLREKNDSREVLQYVSHLKS